MFLPTLEVFDGCRCPICIKKPYSNRKQSAKQESKAEMIARAGFHAAVLFQTFEQNHYARAQVMSGYTKRPHMCAGYMESDRCISCGAASSEHGHNGQLRACSLCASNLHHDAFNYYLYCSVSCQRNNYEAHRTVCGKQIQRLAQTQDVVWNDDETAIAYKVD